MFGAPGELGDSVLPITREVMKYYLWLRNNVVGEQTSVKEVCGKVSKRLEEIWGKSSIPVITTRAIVFKIMKCCNNYKSLMKSYKSQYGKSAKYDKKFTAFVEDTLTLFDIAKCKCVDSDCVCPRECKVPSKECEFLADQRSHRKMMIGTIDRKESSVLEKREI